MALTFDRSLEVRYGVDDDVSVGDGVLHGLRRVVADNPGPYTFKGTATFILGRGDVAVIDPGPDDERHIDAIMDALSAQGERVTHILVTHTHPDHSPGAALLKERTGAPTYGFGPHPVEAEEEATQPPAATQEPARSAGEPVMTAEQTTAATSEEKGDRAFRPDHVVAHADEIAGTGWRIEAVHTPGHLANHLCFALPVSGLLFTGDHVMGWSTSVISPPGGDLDDYLASLAMLLTRPDRVYVPTHGSPIPDPHPFVRGLIAHRHERTRQIIEQLRSGPRSIGDLVAALYVGLDERLVKAAGRSVLAHLDSLERRGDVTHAPLDAARGGETADGYRLVGAGS